MFAQSPEPEAHDKVLTIIQIKLEFGNVFFFLGGGGGEGKTGVPAEKPLGARKRTKNKLNPYMPPGPGIEPRTHWWEVSPNLNSTFSEVM